jgi:nicotinate phosphoribosyltransferase
MRQDILSLETDNQPGEPLIQDVMRNGRRLQPTPTLAEIRARTARDLERLPEPVHRLEPDAGYPVIVAEALKDLAGEVDSRLARQERP